MENVVNNKKLIVGKPKKDKSGTLVYTIKNKTKSSGKLVPVKLGHVFNYLPAGIIDKSETGIGGTSLELDCDRDSIVVQPYFNTAYSKSKLKTIENRYEVLYFGIIQEKEPLKGKSGKAKKINTKTPTTRYNFGETLKDYLLRARRNQQPLKITCVTDQLSSLKQHLEEIQPGLFSKFHVVLDEIDSMQEQSSYRNVMEKCVSIFKQHPAEKRTLISATVKHFHDPELVSIDRIKIQYEKQDKVILACVFSKNVVKETIEQLISDPTYLDNKVVIACNNIAYCVDIADALSKLEHFSGKKIKILCSHNSEHKAGDYFSSLSDGSLLPADINLITAAYFNGNDINEDYHSIILGKGRNPSMRLSADLIYQIRGRCRKKILSNKFIVSTGSEKDYKNYTLEELVASKNDKNLVNQFITELKKSSNNFCNDLATAVENLFADGIRGIPSVWYIERNEVRISYLNIDNRLQQQETHRSYQSNASLTKTLKRRFVVQEHPCLYHGSSQEQVAELDKVQRVKDIIGDLKNLDRSIDYKSEIQKIKNQLYKTVLPVERVIAEIFLLHLSNDKADLSALHKAVDQCMAQKQSLAAFKRLLVNTKFSFFLLNQNSGVDSLLNTYFPIGSEFTVTQMEKRTAEFCKVLTSVTRMESTAIKDLVRKLKAEDTLVRMALLSCMQVRRKNKRSIIIKGYNPFNFGWVHEQETDGQSNG
jgi:hypothetical protein